jgi:hypothetical protein
MSRVMGHGLDLRRLPSTVDTICILARSPPSIPEHGMKHTTHQCKIARGDVVNPPSASITPSSPSGVPLSLLPFPAPELPAALRGEGGRRRPNTRRSTAAAAAAAAEDDGTMLITEAELADAPALPLSAPELCAFDAFDGVALVASCCCLAGSALISCAIESD